MQHVEGSHYNCPYCSKAFVNMSNYYTHRRRMHSSEKKVNRDDKRETSAKEIYQEAQERVIMNEGNGNEISHAYKTVKNDFDVNISDNAYAERKNIIVSPFSVKFL